MQKLRSWIAVVLWATSVGTLVRFVFFILLAPKDLLSSSGKTPFSEILHAFILGFRFDLSAVCYLTLCFWLAGLFLSKRLSLLIWKTLLGFWGFLLLIDIGYFSFYNDRINVLVFGIIEDDTWALIKTFWKNYPVLPILSIALIFTLFFNFKINRNFPPQTKRISGFRTRVAVLVLLLLGARGTFGLFPLGDHDTVVSSVPFLNTLSFGTAHAFSRAIKLKREQIKMGSTAWDANLKEFGYLNREDLAFKDYFESEIPSGKDRFSLLTHRTTLQLKWPKSPHVVLIVMESWGTYGLQFQNEKFDLVGPLKKHFSENLLNTNFLSTTPATTGSLSCLLAGVPQRTISPFLTESDYLQTRLSTSPAATYKKAGYKTRFVYGGNPGWRDMNKFALAQGFDQVEGEIDVEKKLSAKNLKLNGKHDWGIYDEDLFKYVDLTLQEATVPELVVVMTTTNHPPYDLPKSAPTYDLDLKNFPEKDLLIDPALAQKRFVTFRYSSDSLSHFLDSVYTHPVLSKTTVVAATADHTFWVKNFSQDEVFMKSATPFFIALPADVKKQLPTAAVTEFKTSFGGHQDIWPTLYDLSLLDATYDSFGRSLLREHQKSFAATFERMIFTSERGAFVANSQTFSSLKPASHLRFEPTVSLPSDYELAKKYRSLMGALDSYLYHSKLVP